MNSVFDFHFANGDAVFSVSNSDRNRSAAFEYPPLEHVRLLRARAAECEKNGLGESSWNLEVHGPILEWLLRDAPGSEGPLDYRYW